jgi:hypothetical protein
MTAWKMQGKHDPIPTNAPAARAIERCRGKSPNDRQQLNSATENQSLFIAISREKNESEN